MLKNIFFWIAISWTVVVTYFCLVPSSAIPTVSFPNLDKVAHAFFHFVFTVLWFLFFKKEVQKKNQTKLLLVAVFFSFFFGIVIEVLQARMTATRNGDFYDVIANISGAIAALVLVCLSKLIKNNHS